MELTTTTILVHSNTITLRISRKWSKWHREGNLFWIGRLLIDALIPIYLTWHTI
jgi:hypothetical protein